MGHQYQAVQWNRNKITYDLFVVGAIILFLGIFVFIGMQPHPSGNTADPIVLVIRGLGVTAFTMLTIILLIGPLARISPRFNTMLYNRRHLGVITFTVSAAHFGLALLWYHGGGPLNPFVSLFTSNPLYDRIPGFPFELFGLAALFILMIMAVTSHDFWLNNLSAPIWKLLHMLVYPAYGFLVLHIVLGALMTEKAALYPILTASTFGIVSLLHICTGIREWGLDKAARAENGWVRIGDPMAIEDQRAVTVVLPRGDRVAVFRDGASVHAVQNACRHQNGPLGEGRIIDGCITCPWHGWQYNPKNGVSPPPFTEKIDTFDVRMTDGSLYVSAKGNGAGNPARSVTLNNVDSHQGAEASASSDMAEPAKRDGV